MKTKNVLASLIFFLFFFAIGYYVGYLLPIYVADTSAVYRELSKTDPLVSPNAAISLGATRPVIDAIDAVKANCDRIHNEQVDSADEALKSYVLERNGCNVETSTSGAGPAGL